MFPANAIYLIKTIFIVMGAKSYVLCMLYIQKFGVRFFHERSLFCSSRLHFFNQKYSKTVIYSNSYNWKDWMLYLLNVIYCCDKIWIFSIITPVFGVTWLFSLIFFAETLIQFFWGTLMKRKFKKNSNLKHPWWKKVLMYINKKYPFL